MVSHLAILAMAAPPAEGGQGGGNPMYMFGMMALIFAIFWFMIIRPQQKQQRQKQLMIAALKNGDRIVTNGGLFATVKDVHDDKVVAFIAENVKVEIAKHAIAGVVPKKA
jgi:preprotein translocase subunit YajC